MQKRKGRRCMTVSLKEGYRRPKRGEGERKRNAEEKWKILT